MRMKQATNAPKRYLVDTNVFLRALVREDERSHRACVTFLELVRFGTVSAYTSPLVLAEITWTLKSYYSLSKPEVLVAQKSILALKHLRIEAHECVDSAVVLFATHNVKFVDALLASSPAIQSGVYAIVSYDREFDRLEGVVRVEPQDVRVTL